MAATHSKLTQHIPNLDASLPIVGHDEGKVLIAHLRSECICVGLRRADLYHVPWL